MMTIEQIAPYLPYGLTAYGASNMWHIIGATTEKVIMTNGVHKQSLSYENFECEYDLLLRPITSLTTPITHKGETFVPLIKLAKLSLPNRNWIFDEKRLMAVSDLNEFWYVKDMKSFLTNAYTFVPNQLLLFRKCYEWKINLEGIEAVDPASMDVNPYLT